MDPVPPLDPHAEIERLEARIEELADRLESCRKFVLAARIATAAGIVLLAAILLGLIRADGLLLTGAIAAILGGIVVWGSNGSTAKETSEQLAKAEADRAALIGLIQLRTIVEQPTVH